MSASVKRPEVCEVQLSAAVDTVFALALSLLLIEDDGGKHDATAAEMACARDRLTYTLYLRAQELRNLVETGSIDRSPPLTASQG